MDILLKQRIIGAIVLISLAVIFIPMLLSGKSDLLSNQIESNIPPKPIYEIRRPENIELERPPQPSFARPEPKQVKQQPLLDADKQSNAEKQQTVKKNVAQEAANKTPSQKTQPKEPAKLEPSKIAKKSNKNAQLANGWVVQVGSFGEKKNAIRLRNKIQRSGYSSFVNEAASKKGKVYRVRVGPELKRTLADDLRKKMRSKFDLDGIVIRYP